MRAGEPGEVVFEAREAVKRLRQTPIGVETPIGEFIIEVDPEGLDWVSDGGVYHAMPNVDPYLIPDYDDDDWCDTCNSHYCVMS